MGWQTTGHPCFRLHSCRPICCACCCVAYAQFDTSCVAARCLLYCLPGLCVSLRLAGWTYILFPPLLFASFCSLVRVLRCFRERKQHLVRLFIAAPLASVSSAAAAAAGARRCYQNLHARAQVSLLSPCP